MVLDIVKVDSMVLYKLLVFKFDVFHLATSATVKHSSREMCNA